MSEPQVNVDHFYHRPTYNVVGLLTEKSQIPAISAVLQSAGVDITAVEILCGEQGVRILDEGGRYHGLPAATAARASRTSRRARRMPVRRSHPAIHGHPRRNRHCY